MGFHKSLLRWNDVSKATSLCSILSISSPNQYSKVLTELQVLGGRFSDDMAKLFAQEAFALTAQYDICISETLKKLSKVCVDNKNKFIKS